MQLYLNNIRGFSETIIPFQRVNFLVGENSTGKTTVLSILELLSKPGFLYTPVFNNKYSQFGGFKEIVNQLSKDRSFFQIGVEFNDSLDNDTLFQGHQFRFLQSFANSSGNPILSGIKFNLGAHMVSCSRISQKQVTVQVSDVSYSDLSFSDWIHHDQYSSEFIIEQKSRTRPDIVYLIQMIDASIHSDNNSERLFSVLVPYVFSGFNAFSPVRAKPHRFYESFSQPFSRQGDHIPASLKKLLKSKQTSAKQKIARLVSFGTDSRLFDGISLSKYGQDTEGPFSLNVSYGKVMANLANVGYGVSQVLPLSVGILNSKGTVFSLQQPEVHLHPRAQAAFGELLYHSAIDDGNSFFCETHSGYLIDRFRYLVNKSDTGESISQVLFFERDETGNHITVIPIDRFGHFPKDMPDAYSSFFIEEELKMLEF